MPVDHQMINVRNTRKYAIMIYNIPLTGYSCWQFPHERQWQTEQPGSLKHSIRQDSMFHTRQRGCSFYFLINYLLFSHLHFLKQGSRRMGTLGLLAHWKEYSIIFWKKSMILKAILLDKYYFNIAMVKLDSLCSDSRVKLTFAVIKTGYLYPYIGLR